MSASSIPEAFGEQGGFAFKLTKAFPDGEKGPLDTIITEWPAGTKKLHASKKAETAIQILLPQFYPIENESPFCMAYARFLYFILDIFASKTKTPPDITNALQEKTTQYENLTPVFQEDLEGKILTANLFFFRTLWMLQVAACISVDLGEIKRKKSPGAINLPPAITSNEATLLKENILYVFNQRKGFEHNHAIIKTHALPMYWSLDEEEEFNPFAAYPLTWKELAEDPDVHSLDKSLQTIINDMHPIPAKTKTQPPPVRQAQSSSPSASSDAPEVLVPLEEPKTPTSQPGTPILKKKANTTLPPLTPKVIKKVTIASPPMPTNKPLTEEEEERVPLTEEEQTEIEAVMRGVIPITEEHLTKRILKPMFPDDTTGAKALKAELSIETTDKKTTIPQMRAKTNRYKMIERMFRFRKTKIEEIKTLMEDNKGLITQVTYIVNLPGPDTTPEAGSSFFGKIKNAAVAVKNTAGSLLGSSSESTEPSGPEKELTFSDEQAKRYKELQVKYNPDVVDAFTQNFINETTKELSTYETITINWTTDETYIDERLKFIIPTYTDKTYGDNRSESLTKLEEIRQKLLSIGYLDNVTTKLDEISAIVTRKIKRNQDIVAHYNDLKTKRQNLMALGLRKTTLEGLRIKYNTVFHDKQRQVAEMKRGIAIVKEKDAQIAPLREEYDKLSLREGFAALFDYLNRSERNKQSTTELDGMDIEAIWNKEIQTNGIPKDDIDLDKITTFEEADKFELKIKEATKKINEFQIKDETQAIIDVIDIEIGHLETFLPKEKARLDALDKKKADDMKKEEEEKAKKEEEARLQAEKEKEETRLAQEKAGEAAAQAIEAAKVKEAANKEPVEVVEGSDSEEDDGEDGDVSDPGSEELTAEEGGEEGEEKEDSTTSPPIVLGSTISSLEKEEKEEEEEGEEEPLDPTTNTLAYIPITPEIREKAKQLNLTPIRGISFAKSESSFFIGTGIVPECNADILVNATNNGGVGGKGIDSAFNTRGGSAFKEQRKHLDYVTADDTDDSKENIRIHTGSATLIKNPERSEKTLNADYIILAVGPNFNKQKDIEEGLRLLQQAYETIIKLALSLKGDPQNMVICPLSTGEFLNEDKLPLSVVMYCAIDYLSQAIRESKKPINVYLIIPKEETETLQEAWKEFGEQTHIPQLSPPPPSTKTTEETQTIKTKRRQEEAQTIKAKQKANQNKTAKARRRQEEDTTIPIISSIPENEDVKPEENKPGFFEKVGTAFHFGTSTLHEKLKGTKSTPSPFIPTKPSTSVPKFTSLPSAPPFQSQKSSLPPTTLPKIPYSFGNYNPPSTPSKLPAIQGVHNTLQISYNETISNGYGRKSVLFT